MTAASNLDTLIIKSSTIFMGERMSYEVLKGYTNLEKIIIEDKEFNLR